jgi:acrylyl-CoA reductase (NADPH)
MQRIFACARSLEAKLMDGDVTLRVSWSTIDYQHGLAIIGGAPLVRGFSMIPGIDFVGVVASSDTVAGWPPT